MVLKLLFAALSVSAITSCFFTESTDGLAKQETVITTTPSSENGALLGCWYGEIKLSGSQEGVDLLFSPAVPYSSSLVITANFNAAKEDNILLQVLLTSGNSVTVPLKVGTGSSLIVKPLKSIFLEANSNIQESDFISGIRVSSAGAPSDISIMELLLSQNKFVAQNPPRIRAERNTLHLGEFSIKEEQAGVHPRLFVTEGGLSKVHTSYSESPAKFQKLLPKKEGNEMNFFSVEPSSIKDTMVAVGIIAKLSAAYAVTKDESYLSVLEQAIPYLEQFQPEIVQKLYENDLVAGDVLLNLALAYDLLYGRVSEKLLSPIRSALIQQAEQTYTDLLGVPAYPYMQNHFYTPVAGLAVAACAVADEYPGAKHWGVWSRNVLQRVLESLPQDAWCYEGVSYWSFHRYLFAAAASIEAVIGEEIISEQDLQKEELYLAHIFLPKSGFAFDFADTGPRVESDGHSAQEGYDWPWHTFPTRILKAPVLMLNKDRQTALSEELVRLHVGDNPVTRRFDCTIGLLLNEPKTLTDLSKSDENLFIKPFHYFSDMDVVHWRVSWTNPLTTAFAFKSGPPAGHHLAQFLEKFPDSSRNFSHAHPDAGSFILFSRGNFLANDTQYLGKKETAHHNSILVDGVGQRQGGTAWFTFEEPYPTYEKIRLENVWLSNRAAAATAIFGTAYPDTLKITRMERTIVLVEGAFLIIQDKMDSEESHEYEWRLHSDTPAEKLEGDRFEVVNNEARMSIQSLTSSASSSVDPTIVETELYSKTLSRPQQRGYHISFKSPKTKENTFLTAIRIGAKDDSFSSFSATTIAPEKVKLTNGNTSCIVWLKGSEELDGEYAFALFDNDQNLKAAGVYGVSLASPELEITLKKKGSVTIKGKTQGEFAIESLEPVANEAFSVKLNGKY